MSNPAVQRWGSGGPWEERYGYSRVVRAGDLLLTAGCTATVDGVVTGIGDPRAQALTAFGIAVEALAGAGAAVSDVIRTRMYVTDVSKWEEVARVHGEVFGEIRPATSIVEVAKLIDADAQIEIEADVYVA
ncbi:MAG TPA: RidA family protein [Actinoplanes sp.]